jgi:hypothetical protein
MNLAKANCSNGDDGHEQGIAEIVMLYKDITQNAKNDNGHDGYDEPQYSVFLRHGQYLKFS